MKQVSLVPELNFWISKTIDNAYSLNSDFPKLPVRLSESWRCRTSVIELLFNETFTPVTDSSSSSSSGSYTYPYIYQYRRCNLDAVMDQSILRRIQPYRWNCFIYAADSSEFVDIFDMTGTNFITTNNEVDTNSRSRYITYQSTIYESNLPLHDSAKTIDTESEQSSSSTSVMLDPTNIFQLTEQDHVLLEILWNYRNYQTASIDHIDFNQLTSHLSKLIYIYLDAYLNDSIKKYDQTEPITNSMDNLLVISFEKFVINSIYRLKQYDFMVMYNNTYNVNEINVKENVDQTMMLKHKVEDRTLSPSDLINGIRIETDIPWDREYFTIIHDGEILQPDEHFQIYLDTTNHNQEHANVKFLKPTIQIGNRIRMIWGYINPTGLTDLDLSVT